MPHLISPADDTTPTETRRGRAWIDQAAGVRIGHTLSGASHAGSTVRPARLRRRMMLAGCGPTAAGRRSVRPATRMRDAVAASPVVCRNNPTPSNG